MSPEVQVQALPFWADLAVSALIVCGSLVALIGSFSLMRLRTFFERVHAPSVIATLGCWCVVLATVLYVSLQTNELALYPLLLAVFLALTVPVTTIFLMRTGLFRARLAREGVPPPLSGQSRAHDGMPERTPSARSAVSPAVPPALDAAEDA